MQLFLAPMEGVVDALMRDTLTAIGGIDIAVTEFIRVTDHLYPEKVFFNRCPELSQQSKTPSGVPVRIQLLGSRPAAVADNALRAAELGVSAIDLNFGCPAKTVNKSEGGACLLREPNRVYEIVKATRERVPSEVPVTAKIRLGFDDKNSYLDNSKAVADAGANLITVHARSKADGYKPPAYWEYITEIRESIDIPVVANGDIWTLADFKRCKQVTGCEHYMLGRGLLSCPDLALQIKKHLSGDAYTPMGWEDTCNLLEPFFLKTVSAYPAKYTGNRLKQWLFYLSRQYPEAEELFSQIKRSRDVIEIQNEIRKSAESSCTSAA